MLHENLFEAIPGNLPNELIETIAESDGCRIERIVSTGQSSPDGFWYDCGDVEWVVVLCGEAKLRFEGNSQPRHLRAGDHVTIAPHRRHRVEWTTPDEPTVWLAVYFSAEHQPVP
jgi:cupin 2 domain-containing protein